MGMPIAVELVGAPANALDIIFNYFQSVDARFSTYKPESEISRINHGEVTADAYSDEMREIFLRAEKTRQETNGYFSITRPDGVVDPSGIVKGWAIHNAALLAEQLGCTNYFIDAGGDIQSRGTDATDNPWTIGIRNPFAHHEIIKVVAPRGQGVATSGTYLRGQHIYNPHQPGATLGDIVSITVVGPNIYDADRFATAAFAMGRDGILFIEQLAAHEGYAVDAQGVATMTRGFEQHVVTQ